MKTGTNLNIWLLMCCLSIGILDSANTTSGEEPVYFADANLKVHVEANLGISDPTPTDMLGLTSLTCRSKGIVDLTGLEYATNLIRLELYDHRISDISALAGLTHLTHLNLRYNQINDISVLAGLTNLIRLELYNNRISDISALAGLTHLTHLDVGCNHRISDISPLYDLTNLQNLSLGSNPIGDISVIARLTNLTRLCLYNNQISNIAVLAQLTNLVELYLYGNQISDISTIAGLTSLTDLHLGDNQVSDISAVAGLENLTRLELCDNRIRDISALAGLTNMTELHLCENQISDISALLGLTNLTELNLWSNPLNQDARDIYIPQIRENNLGITIYYDYSILTISSTAGGSVSIPGEGVFPYDYGGTLPIVASADTGYHFVFWTGTAMDEGSVANPTAANTTVKLYSDYTLKAHFAMDRGVIYVDDDATGSNDGSSWADAYTYLQDALADADNSAKPVEIRVAQGIYKPDRGVGITHGNRNATFRLINGVTLKGGYAGCGEPDPNARDIRLHETILSGDLNGDDTDVYYPGDFWHDRMRSDNSPHVVTTSETNESAVLHGFTITSGYYLGPPPIVFDPPAYHGGGMVIIAASPTVVDCTFAGNAVTAGGGAVVNLEGSSPTLVNCKFERNYAGSGGAIYNIEGILTLIDCFFINNAASRGAGIYCKASNCRLNNCIFIENTGVKGGGIYSKGNDSLILTNCTFSANFAENAGGGIYNIQDVDPMLFNCILWGNTPEEIQGPASVSYSDVRGGWPGEGNINEDPLFANPGYWADVDDPNVVAEPNDPNAVWVDGDYHLKSQAGRWDPVSESWVQDEITSPCIDAGDPNSPIGHEPFPNGGVINMGAYGGTVEASKSYFGKPVCETIIAGDINGDCKVDFDDLMILMAHWLENHNPNY